MTEAAKIQYVTQQLIPMLQNDLRVAAEGGCDRHGVGTGANFSIALLSLVACEVVGALSAEKSMTAWEATRAFLERVGRLSGDRRYGDYAGLIFAMFRNGVGHSFLPKQCPGLLGRTIWIARCVDELGRPEHETELHTHRITHHLSINGRGARRTFDVVTKLLYVDVSKAIEDFNMELQSATPARRKLFVAAFDRWVRDNSDVKGKDKLTAREKAALKPTP